MATGTISKSGNIDLNLTAHPYVSIAEVENGAFFCLDFAASKNAYLAGNYIRLAFNTVADTDGTLGAQNWVNGSSTSEKWVNKG